tara:strand:- start:2679 stop:3746 length:1068 start_codon:yes stop_codon:yes gene_type:complete
MSDLLQQILGGVGTFTSKYGDLLAGIGGAAATEKGISDTRGVQQGLMRGLTGSNSFADAYPGGLINNINQNMQFKPFTVTSGTGATAQTDASGGLNLNLSPQEQALQQQLLGVSGELAGSIGYGRQQTLMDMLTGNPQDMQSRQQDIYGQLQAMQGPEQERARLMMEQRLANQGRLGVQTAMFGGTPENFAMEKAIAEQQAGTAVSAMEQARAEQAQYSGQTASALDQMLRENLAASQSIPNMLQAAYAPQAGLLGALSPSVDLSKIGSALQAGSSEAAANLGMQGMTTQQNLEAQINSQRQQQLQGLFQLLAGGQNANAPGNTNNNLGGSTGAATLAQLMSYWQDPYQNPNFPG